MRTLFSPKSALFTLLLAAGLGAASLISHGSPPDADSASQAGLSHRAKPSAYSNEVNGLFLGVDASQASWRVGGEEKFLPVAIVLANSTRNGVWISDANLSYRAGDTGVWQNMPTYKEVMSAVTVSSTTRRLLGSYDPFTTRFRAMRRARYSPYPGNDPDRIRLRVEDAWVSGQSYVYAIIFLPNPGAENPTATRYLRLIDPKAKVEITTGFRMKEPK